PQQILRGRARAHGSIQQRLRPVRDRLGRIEVIDRTEAVALRTRAVGGVEAEAAGLQLGYVDAAVRAGHRRTVERFVVLAARRLQADQHQSIGDLQRRRYRRLQPARVQRSAPVYARLARRRLQDDAVDDGLDRVVLALLQPHPLLDLGNLAVDANAVALLIERLKLLAELALAPAHHRSQNGNALSRRFRLVALHDLRDDLVCALAGDRAVAIRAMRLTHAGPQQTQVVVDLSNCAHGRARRPRGRLLLNRNRRAQAFDRVHIRPLHLVEKLARVGRERLHIAALTLSVDGVEGERTLARAGQPRDHRQGIPRDRDRDVPQVVLPRTAHLNVSEAHRRASADYGHLPRIQAAGELPFQAVPAADGTLRTVL